MSASEKKRPRRKKVSVVTSTGVVLATYESAREAQRRLQIGQSDICQVCLGNQKEAKRFLFIHADAGSELNQLSLEELNEAKRQAVERGDHVETIENNKPKRIMVVTSQGACLAVYGSQGEASRKTGINGSQISAVVLGKHGHAKGFIFQLDASDSLPLNPLTLEELCEVKQRAIENGEHDETSMNKKRKRARRQDSEDEDDEYELQDDDDELEARKANEEDG